MKAHPYIRITFSPENEVQPAELEWDDMQARLSLLLTRQEAAGLLVRLAEYVADDDADPTTPLQLEMEGRAYMSGRLPDDATHSARTGEELPGVIVLDEVHGHPGTDEERIRSTSPHPKDE